MPVSTTYASTVTSVETLDTNVPAAAANAKTITQSGFNTAHNLNSATAVPVTKDVYFNATLVAGALTIDLRTLTGTNDLAVDFNGLKVQVAKFKAKTTNAGAVTIAKGASNGSTFMGSAWSFVLAPGQEVTFYGNDAAPDVSATVKTIDLTGTGTDVVETTLIAG